MAEITKIITQSDTQHILCLNPNHDNIPNQVQGHFLLQQLRSKSVLEISVLKQESFHVDFTVSDFALCYCCLVDGLCGELKDRIKRPGTLRIPLCATDRISYNIYHFNNNNNNNNNNDDDDDDVTNNSINDHHSITVHRSQKAACALILQQLTDTNIIPRKSWKISDSKVFLYRQEHVRCIDRLLRKKIVSTIVKIQKRWRKYLLLRRRRVEGLRERAVAMRRQMEEDEIRREEEEIRREKEEREEQRHREEEERRKEECSVQIQRAFRGYDVRKVGWVWKCLCGLGLLSS
jgi:myosin heavy subunit